MFELDLSYSILLILCLVAACGFEFVNGFHDTANAVATVIYTNSLKPWVAVIWSGMMNALGVFLGGIGVAMGKRFLFFLEHNDKQRNRFGFAVQDLQQPRCVGGERGHRVRLADCYPSVPWQKRSVGQRWRWR